MNCDLLEDTPNFNNDSCECQCNLFVAAFLNQDTADANCDAENTNFVFNSSNCGCECGLEQVDCDLFPANPNFNEDGCECRCDRFVAAGNDLVQADENCNAENTNFVFNSSNCGCECGLEQVDCDLIPANPNFNEDGCQCQCDLFVNADGNQETADANCN